MTPDQPKDQPTDPMAHPDDLLAEYVDGTLPERERAAVDAHLETCARCRGEVELARGAVVALRDLHDVPVPVGVTGRVLEEARSSAPKKTSSSGPTRWIAGLAAAAVIVGVLAVALNRDEGSKGSLAVENAPGQGASRTAALDASGVPLEDQHSVNYEGDDGAIVLASEVIKEFRRAAPPEPTASDSAGGAEPAAPSGAQAAQTPAATETTAAFAGASKVIDSGPAIRCLEQAGLPPTSTGAEFTLRRLVEAKYNGDPAYLAVFLQGPGAGQPPDRADVFVLSRKDCSLVNFLNVGFDAVGATGGT